MASSTTQKTSKTKNKTPRVTTSKSEVIGKKKKIDARGILRAASEVDFTNKDRAALFEAEYKERFMGRSSAQNILCVLAKQKEWPDDLNWSDDNTKDFLNWILKGYHNLLEYKDKTTKLCPFHLALTHNHTAFVDTILKFPNLININKVITMEDQSGNALHIALENSHSSFGLLVERCIQFPGMFIAKHPTTGNTPLHDCMLIDLDNEEDDEESEDEYLSEDGDFEPDETDDDYAHSGTSEEGQAEQFDVHYRETYNNSRVQQPEGFAMKRTQSMKVPVTPECLSERLPFVKILVENDKSALYLYNAAKRTPYQERLYQLQRYYQKTAGSSPESQEFQEFASNDSIGSFIRSYCVTNFLRNDVTKCLYNTGKEKQIEFDLGGLGRDTISDEYLKQLSSHLKFESILKYVALPKIVMEGRPRRSKSSATTKSMRGRSDLTDIFKWLRDNGVKKIVKVIVLDDQEPCHADSAIEEALVGFQVEIWDWKRLDLSTEVIRKSTSVVKEISLYSSGNHSVLMGWASTDGLPNVDYFPDLKDVNLYYREGYETPDRLLGYVNEFKSKIEGRSDGRIKVNEFRDDRNSSHASEFQSRTGDSQSESPWIHCMMRLSTLLKSACDGAHVKPVKVAIVDDGVDVSLESLQGKIALGQSFCPYANSSEMMTPYFVSSSNHGTSMATLICSLCPMVQLYVARLDQRQASTSNQRHITADSAAQAVRWATDCGVDIISMSWTIETSLTETPEMRSLQDAIRRASTQNIVMFCSTSDQGSMTHDLTCYPGDFGGCIKIGSASNTGDPMSWVKVDRVDYLLPGSNVPFSITEGKTNLHESGSSIATAAASGLAAFLMSSSWLLDKDDTYLKNLNNMKRAFSYLAQGQSQRFPAVAERLEKFFKRRLARMQNKDEKTVRNLPMEWSEDCQSVLKDIMTAIKDTT